MRRRRGMTLAGLIMALAITSIVGAGVVAMTDAVARALDEGRSERERTIASAVAGTRLSSVVAPCNCTLEITPVQTVLWRGDTLRDGNVQATELAWVRFEEARGELLFEWVEFPEGWSERDREASDQTCSPDENWDLLRTRYRNAGHLRNRVLLDGLAGVEPAIDDAEQSEPLQVRRLAWRLSWLGVEGVDSTTVVAGGIHHHAIPEGSG
jgi:hypothetical protein